MSLPAAGYLSNAARTEGEQKTAFEDQLKGIKQIPGAGVSEQALTIASGSVTPASGSSGIIAIDTEASGATDDLTNIAQTNVDDNSLLILRNANAARVVVVKNNAGGTGQISTKSGGDFVLADPDRHWLLVKRAGSLFKEVACWPPRDTAPILTKTANYTTTAADRGQLIDCTANSWTLTLVAAATAGKGFLQPVRNSGTGVLTIDPNSAELIEGQTTLVLNPGASGLLHCDGTGWSLLCFSMGPQKADLTGHCRLVYTSASVITLNPYQGKTVPVKAGGLWQARELPSAGVALTLSGLTGSTDYNIYLYDSSGTLTLEASTTGHSTDATTGVEVKSTDATRTLVGKIRATGATTTADSATQRFVLSFFNRAQKSGLNAFTADRSTASGTYAELNSEIRCEFLTWADESVFAALNGEASFNSTGYAMAAIGFDGTTAEPGLEAGNTAYGASTSNPTTYHCAGYKAGFAEGYHYATLLGRTQGGLTITFSSSSGSGRIKTHLHVALRG